MLASGVHLGIVAIDERSASVGSIAGKMGSVHILGSHLLGKQRMTEIGMRAVAQLRNLVGAAENVALGLASTLLFRHVHGVHIVRSIEELLVALLELANLAGVVALSLDVLHMRSSHTISPVLVALGKVAKMDSEMLVVTKRRLRSSGAGLELAGLALENLGSGMRTELTGGCSTDKTVIAGVETAVLAHKLLGSRPNQMGLVLKGTNLNAASLRLALNRLNTGKTSVVAAAETERMRRESPIACETPGIARKLVVGRSIAKGSRGKRLVAVGTSDRVLRTTAELECILVMERSRNSTLDGSMRGNRSTALTAVSLVVQTLGLVQQTKRLALNVVGLLGSSLGSTVVALGGAEMRSLRAARSLGLGVRGLILRNLAFDLLQKLGNFGIEILGLVLELLGLLGSLLGLLGFLGGLLLHLLDLFAVTSSFLVELLGFLLAVVRILLVARSLFLHLLGLALSLGFLLLEISGLLLFLGDLLLLLLGALLVFLGLGRLLGFLFALLLGLGSRSRMLFSSSLGAIGLGLLLLLLGLLLVVLGLLLLGFGVLLGLFGLAIEILGLHLLFLGLILLLGRLFLELLGLSLKTSSLFLGLLGFVLLVSSIRLSISGILGALGGFLVCLLGLFAKLGSLLALLLGFLVDAVSLGLLLAQLGLETAGVLALHLGFVLLLLGLGLVETLLAAQRGSLDHQTARLGLERVRGLASLVGSLFGSNRLLLLGSSSGLGSTGLAVGTQSTALLLTGSALADLGEIGIAATLLLVSRCGAGSTGSSGRALALETILDLLVSELGILGLALLLGIELGLALCISRGLLVLETLGNLGIGLHLELAGLVVLHLALHRLLLGKTRGFAGSSGLLSSLLLAQGSHLSGNALEIKSLKTFLGRNRSTNTLLSGSRKRAHRSGLGLGLVAAKERADLADRALDLGGNTLEKVTSLLDATLEEVPEIGLLLGVRRSTDRRRSNRDLAVRARSNLLNGLRLAAQLGSLGLGSNGLAVMLSHGLFGLARTHLVLVLLLLVLGRSRKILLGLNLVVGSILRKLLGLGAIAVGLAELGLSLGLLRLGLLGLLLLLVLGLLLLGLQLVLLLRKLLGFLLRLLGSLLGTSELGPP
eukprot:comp22359_c0_seq2/m.54009 comp22359_c0_seq2/g.54009  ORF comp22359_c0_seq2/g.54009 comp22359_c0_seq2/m.54009 type:complete len:1105 (-) comp22359_c0_seq2:2601-5915(-)